MTRPNVIKDELKIQFDIAVRGPSDERSAARARSPKRVRGVHCREFCDRGMNLRRDPRHGGFACVNVREGAAGLKASLA